MCWSRCAPIEQAHTSRLPTRPGIDPKFLSQVFERFKQADTSARDHRRPRLGLALSRTWSACTLGSARRSPGWTRIDLLDHLPTGAKQESDRVSRGRRLSRTAAALRREYPGRRGRPGRARICRASCNQCRRQHDRRRQRARRAGGDCRLGDGGRIDSDFPAEDIGLLNDRVYTLLDAVRAIAADSASAMPAIA